MKSFGDVLAEMIEERGYTQSRLARESGVSRQSINRIIAGEVKDPRLPLAFRLADVLGVPLDEFKRRMESDEEGSNDGQVHGADVGRSDRP